MLRTREVLIASSNCPWTEWFEKSFPRAFESEFCHLWPSLLKDARFSSLKDIKVISWSPFTDNIFSFYVLFNIWIMFTHCNCEFQSHPTSLMFQATSDLTTKLSYPALVVLWFISKLIGFHVKCFLKNTISNPIIFNRTCTDFEAKHKVVQMHLICSNLQLQVSRQRRQGEQDLVSKLIHSQIWTSVILIATAHI